MKNVEYPSLDNMEVDYLPFDVTQTPKSKTASRLPKSNSRPRVQDTKTPEKPTSALQHIQETASASSMAEFPPSPKKGAVAEPAEPTSKMPGAFEIPKGSKFDFTVPSVAEFQAKTKAFLDDLKFSAENPILPPPQLKGFATPSSKSQFPPITPPSQIRHTPAPAATTGRGKMMDPEIVRQRFNDAHRAAFSKMDSIMSHYAAKRDISGAVSTPPQNPQKGLKRTKSHHSPTKDEEKAPIISPSPVKKLPEPPMKRTRLDPESAATSASSRIPTGPSSVRRTSGRYGTAPARRGANALPPLPKSTIRPVPDLLSGRHSATTTTSSTGTFAVPTTPASRIPNRKAQAPHTIAPIALSFPRAPTHEPSATPLSGAGMKAPVSRLARAAAGVSSIASPMKKVAGEFTFQARARGHQTFSKLSDMHDRKVAKSSAPEGSVLAPRAFVEEAQIIDDPFAAPVRKAVGEFRIRSPIKGSVQLMGQTEDLSAKAKGLADEVKAGKKRTGREAELSDEDCAGKTISETPMKQKVNFDKALPKTPQQDDEILKDATPRHANIANLQNDDDVPMANTSSPFPVEKAMEQAKSPVKKTPTNEGPSKKRMRMDSDAGKSVKKSSNSFMSRLEQLATPKRRNEKGAEMVRSERARRMKTPSGKTPLRRTPGRKV